MRAKRRTEQEQYDIIMECRQSGLSDYSSVRRKIS